MSRALVETELVLPPELSIRDRFLDMAKKLIKDQRMEPDYHTGQLYTWHSETLAPGAFNEPLFMLATVRREATASHRPKQVEKVEFKFIGDDAVTINIDKKYRPNSYGLPFDEYVLERLDGFYDTHEHDICLAAITEKRKADLALRRKHKAADLLPKKRARSKRTA